jgi:hypothetical protein
MAMVSINCPRCGVIALAPAEAFFVAAVDEAFNEKQAGAACWICAGCDDLVVISIGWRLILPMLNVGVPLIEECVELDRPPHPECPAPGRPFTLDDLLNLHELLNTDNWIDTVEYVA